MKNRRLVTSDIRRSLGDYYICNTDKIPLSRKMSIDEVIGKSKEFAVDDALNVFECFNWFNAPRKVFEEEQDKLIKGIL